MLDLPEKLIRVETRSYYRRGDGGIIMKIEDKSFLEMKQGEEVWQYTSTTIPLIKGN